MSSVLMNHPCILHKASLTRNAQEARLFLDRLTQTLWPGAPRSSGSVLANSVLTTTIESIAPVNNENPLCLPILLILCKGEVSSETPFAKFMPSLAGPEAPALPPSPVWNLWNARFIFYPSRGHEKIAHPACPLNFNCPRRVWGLRMITRPSTPKLGRVQRVPISSSPIPNFEA